MPAPIPWPAPVTMIDLSFTRIASSLLQMMISRA
jgi:hypothetical protein